MSLSNVKPIKNTLVADFASLLPSFASDITAGQWQPDVGEQVAGLKLEGLAILDSKHVIIVNDNDLNVDSLFDETIATFEDDSGAYDQKDADGFIKLNALRLKLQAKRN